MIVQDVVNPEVLQNTNNSECELNILVVDDNVLVQQVIKYALESYGYKLTMADNGKQALEALQQKDFDLILMDLQMPVMDGFETTAYIRAKEAISGGHIPIIAITSYFSDDHRQKCFDAGMDEYLEKPFDLNKLFAAIHRLSHKKLQA